MKGKLFVFEGLDNVGKTTIINLIHKSLTDKGLPSIIVGFPGIESGTIGNLVYNLHHSPDNFGISSIQPITLQILHIAAHVDNIIQLIKPALTEGIIVLLDRYWWSTYAYGKSAGLKEKTLKRLIDIEREYWGQYSPTRMFLIQRKINIEISVEATQYLSKIQNEYNQLCKIEELKYPISIIENNSSLNESVDRIIHFINPLL